MHGFAHDLSYNNAGGCRERYSSEPTKTAMTFCGIHLGRQVNAVIQVLFHGNSHVMSNYLSRASLRSSGVHLLVQELPPPPPLLRHASLRSTTTPTPRPTLPTNQPQVCFNPPLPMTLPQIFQKKSLSHNNTRKNSPYD